MRKPQFAMNIFKDRRRRLGDKMVGSALIVASTPEYDRNADTSHTYRADSNMVYLTGFEEPGSILLFRPGQTPETILFVRPRDVERETWDGFRYGPELTVQHFQVDAAYPIEDFPKIAPNLLVGMEKLFYRLYKNPAVDDLVKNVLQDQVRVQGRTGFGLLPIYDANTIIGELRVIKSEYEITLLREACEISAQAHMAAMRATRPGVTERQLEGILFQQFYSRGAARVGYNSIVATGNNATTLHYVFNDQVCKDGDLLLIDAGAEHSYYTGDITRTYPVNGRFTEPQRRVYEGVLKVQKTIIESLKPGIPFRSLHDMARDLLTDLMLELGLFVGRKEDIIATNAYRNYYPHGVGHWLGMDVHDAGLYITGGKQRPIEANMCFTIEPGLYIPANDTAAPTELRGIGVRIEDDIRITETGCEVLTSAVPKEIKDIESIVGVQSL